MPIDFNDLLDALNGCIEHDAVSVLKTAVNPSVPAKGRAVWMDAERTRKVLEEFGIELEPEEPPADAAGEGV